MELTENILKEKFNEFNKLYFNNELKKCKLYIYNTKYELGMFLPRTYNSQPIIKIAKKPIVIKQNEWTEELLKDTLVHEMIHYYVRDILKDNSIISKHGLKFRKINNNIYKKYGYKVEIGDFIKKYHILKNKKSLTVNERLEILYLKPLNWFLSWLL